MSLAAMLWALTEADCDGPTDALYLVAMADFTDGDGRGCYASQTTLAAHARVSRRTSQRVQERLAERGLIVPGDQQMVRHIRPDRRPLVWDLAMPARGVILTPRDDDGASTETPRGVKRAPHGASPVTHDPSTYPSRTEQVARGETADGAPLGCAEHRDRRRSSCDDCMRVTLPALDTVPPASNMLETVKAARDKLRSA